MITEKTIQEILDRVDLISVIKEYVSDLKIDGVKAECRCPFHAERTPSFHVNKSKGLWYCFGCHEGGNVFQFIQKIESCDFPEAVRKVAERCNIKIDEDDEETPEQKEYRLKREAMMVINEKCCRFYADLLWEKREDSLMAQSYIKSRKWSFEFAKEYRMGFAPEGGQELYMYAKSQAMSLPLMEEMGLLKRGKNGGYYDVYRDRLMIPIRTRGNRVTGFTARLLNEQVYKDLKEAGKLDYVPPKYINSKESAIYQKKDSIFGIEAAINLAVKQNVMYLVEGGPDVLRLQSLGIYNTVASLGGAWTDNQLKQLKKYNVKLCFIPDNDPPKGEQFGAGVRNVMANGIKAINLGFSVSVKELCPFDTQIKNDPDSYIHTQDDLRYIEEKDFIIWYAEKKLGNTSTIADKSGIIEEIAGFIATIDNVTNASIIESTLAKTYGLKKEWHAAISEAKKTRKEQAKVKRDKSIDLDIFAKYGFYEDGNCCYSIGKEGIEFQWSNFVLVPLFHIKDAIMPKRLFKITNSDRRSEIIELKQSDLTSQAKFSERIEGLGNYIWLGSQPQLNKLKMYLYEQTESATEITQLGWQSNGFWAFGNGIFADGKWLEADEYGIVRMDDDNYYLPAFSKIYAKEKKLFQFERQFVNSSYSNISLRGYTDKLIEVFGDNAKVGICFLLATLFKDVITGITKNFPILNLFGQKGSGKSEMGHSLMAFFIKENIPLNLQNATDPALAEAVAQSANALVHLDEYKNTIDLTRREFLKGLYDGVGRSRMNMDRDKKREMTAVDCGVIVSGQELPTIDNALFSRLIFLTFNTSEFSREAKARFNELTQIRKLGCSHLTLEILAHRKRFEQCFMGNYREVLDDVINRIDGEGIEDRILRSWVMLLASFRTLEDVLDLSFSYEEMINIAINGIKNQNAECKSNNELAMFWDAVEVMQQNGVAINGADFRIKYENKLKTRLKDRDVVQEWSVAKPVLYVNFKTLLAAYKRFAKGQNDTVVAENTLRSYMEVSQEFLGMKQAFRFQLPDRLPNSASVVTRADGSMKVERATKLFQTYCFDYDALSQKYGINLEYFTPEESAEEDDDDKFPI